MGDRRSVGGRPAHKKPAAAVSASPNPANWGSRSPNTGAHGAARPPGRPACAQAAQEWPQRRAAAGQPPAEPSTQPAQRVLPSIRVFWQPRRRGCVWGGAGRLFVAGCLQRRVPRRFTCCTQRLPGSVAWLKVLAWRVFLSRVQRPGTDFPLAQSESRASCKCVFPMMQCNCSVRSAEIVVTYFLMKLLLRILQ